MSIHFSYKKKDLTKIIQDNNLNINIKLKRENICKELLNYIDEYNLQYLYKQNENMSITIKDRDEIIKTARKIKSFINSGLDTSKNIYINNDELIYDAVYISQFGEISSVRKAIKLVQETLNIKIPIIIPEKVQEELNEKEKLKKDMIPRLQVSKGKYYVSFD